MPFRYPGQKAKLSAAEINRMTEAADRSALRRNGLREFSIADDQQSHWVWLRNGTGSDRLRFDCMSLGAPIFEMLEDGTVDLMFVGEVAAADVEAPGGGERVGDGEQVGERQACRRRSRCGLGHRSPRSRCAPGSIRCRWGRLGRRGRRWHRPDYAMYRRRWRVGLFGCASSSGGEVARSDLDVQRGAGAPFSGPGPPGSALPARRGARWCWRVVGQERLGGAVDGDHLSLQRDVADAEAIAE